MVATGATAVRPPIEGIGLRGVSELRTLDDAARLRRRADGAPGPVVVIGGGYIGLETAEAFHHRGFPVVVITSGQAVLDRTLDPDLGQNVVEAMENMGIRVVTGMRVECINGDDKVQSVGCEGETFPAELVVLGLGSRPETELALQAGIPVGDTGAIAVDRRQHTEIEGIWSAGDCAPSPPSSDRTAGQLPFGDYRQQGRSGSRDQHRRWTRRVPRSAGNRHHQGLRSGNRLHRVNQRRRSGSGIPNGDRRRGRDHHRRLLARAAPITIRVIAEAATNRILGAQIVGGPGAGKRIDVFATAIWNEMTAHELAWTDLAYAPPFSGVWDLIHIAARRATYYPLNYESHLKPHRKHRPLSDHGGLCPGSADERRRPRRNQLRAGRARLPHPRPHRGRGRQGLRGCQEPSLLPTAGLAELREAVADATTSNSGVDVSPSQVLVTNGGKYAVFAACATLLDPGDEVIVPAPYWVSYPGPSNWRGELPYRC